MNMTTEEKKQIYAIYQDMFNEYEKALLNGNIQAAGNIKCDILWRINYLLELSAN